jgi:hypothetical protein
VMSAIERCRTVALGGHVARCEDCAHTQIAYNSLYGDSSVKLSNANSDLLLVQPIDSSRLLERPEGSPPLGAKHRAATLYAVGSARDPDHEAVIRFSGEAPRRRAHSADGIEAMELFGVTATSARYRRPVTKARPDVEQGASTPRRPKPLRPPAAMQRQPGFRRS